MGNQGGNFGFGGMAGMPSMWGGSMGGPMGMYGANPYGSMGMPMQQMPWLGGQVGQAYNPFAMGGPGMQGNFGAGLGQLVNGGNGSLQANMTDAVMRGSGQGQFPPNLQGGGQGNFAAGGQNQGFDVGGAKIGALLSPQQERPLEQLIMSLGYNPFVSGGNTPPQTNMGVMTNPNLGGGFPASHSSMMDHPWARTTPAQK